MSPEDVDVAERHILHAGNRTAIVHQLTHVAPACAEAHEPHACYGPELARLLVQPDVDARVPLHTSIESKEVPRTLIHPQAPSAAWASGVVRCARSTDKHRRERPPASQGAKATGD